MKTATAREKGEKESVERHEARWQWIFLSVFILRWDSFGVSDSFFTSAVSILSPASASIFHYETKKLPTARNNSELFFN